VSRPPTLRVASGAWKGRRLEAPAAARPTSGRARAALFDILQERLAGARVLELFAGSGAVGIEALSRGAARTVFVEIDAAALRRNVARLGPQRGTAEIVAAEAAEGIARLLGRSERFDLVFADPPYGAVELRELIGQTAALVAPGGALVIQTDASAHVEAAPGGLRLAARRAYGRNVFWFFERAAADASRPAGLL